MGSVGRGAFARPAGPDSSHSAGEMAVLLLTVIVAAAALFGALGYVACGLSAVVAHGRWPTLGGQRLVDVIARLVRRPWVPDRAFLADNGGDLGPTPLTLCLWVLLLAGVAAALGWLALQFRRFGVGRHRPGFASPTEVRRHMSEAALRRRSRFLYERRRLRRMAANELGVYIGRDAASDTALWAAAEDSWVVVGPTRSGKTMRVLVRTILDAPGPVVTTSIRLDTLTLTASARDKVGPVSVFDPLATTGWPTPMHWSPIRGCEDPLVARRRANGFAAATGIDTSHGDGAYWVRAAARVIRAYLHAAALGTATLDDLLSWAHSPTHPRPVVILRRCEDRAARGWADMLESAAHRDPRQRDSVWSVIEAALDCFSDQRVAAACEDRGEPFDVPEFLSKRGTLYAVGSVDEQELLAPLITAMLEDVTAEARTVARRSPHGRLQPFLTAAIDEAATIAPLPSLPTMIASDGGNGITTMMVLQSPAQARKRWGAHDAAAMWDASTVRLIFGGLSGTEDLEAISRLAGMVDEQVRSHSRSRRDVTDSHGVRQVPALSVAGLRSLPEGHAVLFHRRALPVEVETTPWWQTKSLRDEIGAGRTNLGI